MKCDSFTYYEKPDLILNLSNSSNLSKTDAKIAVKVILEELTQGIVSGKGVEIRGFGGFIRNIVKLDKVLILKLAKGQR